MDTTPNQARPDDHRDDGPAVMPRGQAPSGVRRAGKAGQRREQLATAAIASLAEHGYARTGLRDIAARSDFSHGVLHYYFADKGELIAECIRRYDDADRAGGGTDPAVEASVRASASAQEGAELIANALARAIETDSAVHRLWYDLRNQAYYEDESEEDFRAEVARVNARLMARVWALVRAYAHRADGAPVLDERQTYHVVDGLFLGALECYLAGEDDALENLRSGVRTLLPRLVA